MRKKRRGLRNKDPFASREAKKYEHPVPSREFILEHLNQRGTPATYHDLLQEFELEDSNEREAVRRRLIAMARDGQLYQNRKGAYGPVSKMELISGRILGHREGFGFVEPDEGGEDLYLNPRQMRKVFPNDKVLARITSIDRRGRREAIIVEVIEHNTHTLVGRIHIKSGIAMVEPANRRISQDILIPPSGLGGAKDGQMVLLEITTQPSATTRPIGEVVTVLGDHMAPGMEIDVAIYNHEIPHEWPEEVLTEASTFEREINPSTVKNYKDLRELNFVTIDGEDAKDFDDAVCCIPQTKTAWKLYVAIADVSHYVKPNTALDAEALNRGNSVYFPERVIPMLPEILSNELCSLRPNVDRLTLVCEMIITAAGKIKSFDFYPAIIHSKARLTYNIVYSIMQKNEKEMAAYQSLIPSLENLFTIYKILHKTRLKRGAIDFDLPETKIIFGKDRKIDRIIPSERNDAHRVIEECMLCANISAALFLIKHDNASLFRIHEGPTAEKLLDLRQFLYELGLKFPSRKKPTSSDYANLLHSIQGRPDAHLIQTVLLRSLSQAVYSPENKGHFGLAFDAYAHFTSPIRRYPDLLVHRAIKQILSKKIKPETQNQLTRYGEHCSMTERRADEATRDAIEWLKCEFMLNKVGEEFSGVISGVTSFGLFVELAEIYIEGLVHISSLQNDYYHFNAIKHSLNGERTGKQYRLGDVVKVKVAKVDLDDRKIDLILVEELKASKKHKKKKRRK